MCGPMLCEELDFWGIPEHLIADCCWRTYASFAHEQGIMRQVESALDFPQTSHENIKDSSSADRIITSYDCDVISRAGGIREGNSSLVAGLSSAEHSLEASEQTESQQLCVRNQMKGKAQHSSDRQSHRKAKKDEKITHQFSPRNERNKHRVSEIRRKEKTKHFISQSGRSSQNANKIYEKASGSPNKDRFDASALKMSASNKQTSSEQCCDVTRPRESVTSARADCKWRTCAQRLWRLNRSVYVFLEHPQSSRGARVS